MWSVHVLLHEFALANPLRVGCTGQVCDVNILPLRHAHSTDGALRFVRRRLTRPSYLI
jgi:hypothetical protein